MNSSTRLLFVLVTLLGSFQEILCHSSGSETNNTLPAVFSTNHDLMLIVNQSETVTFQVENSSLLVDEPVKLDFSACPEDVIHIEPDSRVIVLPSTEAFSLTFFATDAGITTVTSKTDQNNTINLKNAFVRITVQNSKGLDVFSQVVGWTYFVAWSISFYPQVFENWKRKSVIGLSFDFLGLNVIGFCLYALFNIGLYWIKPIQDEYFNRHTTGVNPVQLNDVIFSIHAAFACFVTIFQCVIYERGNQSVSRTCKIIIVGIILFLVISLILSFVQVLEPLDFLYFCSYVKLFITLIKYVPQAYLNFRRKSTLGWSIGNILLDFTGGFLSIIQMFIIAYNENDWSSIFGDPTKFGLGLFSVLFDIVFILQHYVFYRNNAPSEELINDGDFDEDEDDEHNDIHD